MRRSHTGVRLWHGAEFWADPEIDQGHGLGDTHGVAGFPSAEAYKLGDNYPYARVQRYFVRQTIDLGGESQKVDADFHQFAGTQTENRLVLTVGRFGIVDLFDTNRCANSPKTDFLNWTIVNAGTFDYAGDAWATPTARLLNGIRASLRCAAASSICHRPRPAARSTRRPTVSTRHSASFSWSAKSRNGTNCGDNRAS